MRVAWFSAGVSSAVATKLLISSIDRVIYTHIDDQHPDTLRFVKDCEQWFGKRVEMLQSAHRTVESACLASGGRGYLNGVGGAACTKTLKKAVRKQWEYELPHGTKLEYVWGLDYGEQARCDRIRETMTEQMHIFPLVDLGMDKTAAHQMLTASGIKRPAMYDLGYSNNNCIGCIKGGMAYHNRIRVDFPEVFAARALLERRIGASCINGVYLDELDPSRGRNEPPIVADCGVICELISI